MERLPPEKREYCHGCNRSVDFKLAVVQPGETPFYFCPTQGCTHMFHIVEGPLEEPRPMEQFE